MPHLSKLNICYAINKLNIKIVQGEMDLTIPTMLRKFFSLAIFSEISPGKRKQLMLKISILNNYIHSQTFHQQSVCLREVSTYGTLKTKHLYVAGTITKCQLMAGVLLQEVSIRRGVTVRNVIHFFLWYTHMYSL